MEQNIVIKGTPQKNRISLILLIAGIVLVLISFVVAAWVYEEVDIYMDSRYLDHLLVPAGYKYDYSFNDFFFGEFFNFSCFYGYVLIVGIIAAVVGIIMKASTEKCEITVTSEAISGKLPHGKEVHIPLNQITAINRSSFNGVLITSNGNISNFHCIENCEEVIKAISYLLTIPHRNAQPDQVGSAPVSNGTEAEQLKRLKDLLDAGVLTQEEFEAKKKQILGI